MSRGAAACPVNWDYDADGRLLDEVYTLYDSSLSQTESYVYNLAGTRLTMTIDKGYDGTVDQTVTDEYDIYDRLQQEQIADSTGTVIQTTTYAYTGTQETDEQVRSGDATGPLYTATTYAYDLEGRLSQAEVTTYRAGVASRIERLTYGYDPDGNRVSTLDEVDANADGTFESRTDTEYLIDKHNDTGYRQVLQATASNADTGAAVQTVVYTIGLAVISQATEVPGGAPTGSPLVLHSDGGGSTRLLTDLSAAIAQSLGVLQIYNYDAFGNALGFDPAAALTTLLYRGQQFDAATGLQYLRARYYDPTTGRFTEFDPFFGSMLNPLTLQKYLYVGSDPINFMDPSGLLLAGGFFGGFSLGQGLDSSSNAATIPAGAKIISVLSSTDALLLGRLGGSMGVEQASMTPTKDGLP